MLTTRSTISSALVGDDPGANPGRCYLAVFCDGFFSVVLIYDHVCQQKAPQLSPIGVNRGAFASL